MASGVVVAQSQQNGWWTRMFEGRHSNSTDLPNAASMTSSDVTPLYFLHIPKTAGTSFNQFVEAQFHADQVLPAHLWRQLLSVPAFEVASYKLVWGHFYCFLHRHVPAPLRYLVFLRDPIERALSHYGHLVRDNHHYLHGRTAELGSLHAFIDDPETATVVTNFQVRSLALDLDPYVAAPGLTDAELAAGELERRLETAPFDRPIEELLKIAKQRLEQMAFIGITERYEESIALCCHRFSWPGAASSLIRRTNVNLNRPSRLQVAAKDLQRLVELNTADQALYNYACELFDRMLALSTEQGLRFDAV